MRGRKAFSSAGKWSLFLLFLLLLSSFASAQQPPDKDDQRFYYEDDGRRRPYSERRQDPRDDYPPVDRDDLYIRRNDGSRNRDYEYRDREGRYYRDRDDRYEDRYRDEDEDRREGDRAGESRRGRDGRRSPDSRGREDTRSRGQDRNRRDGRYNDRRDDRGTQQDRRRPDERDRERDDRYQRDDRDYYYKDRRRREEDRYRSEYYRDYYRDRYRDDEGYYRDRDRLERDPYRNDSYRYTDRDRRDKYREDEYRTRDTFSRGMTPAPHLSLPGEAPFRNVRGSEGTWTKVRSLEVLQDSLMREHQDEWEYLRRFGEDFFDRSEAELVKSEASTVPEDYEISPGDELDVTTYSTRGGESKQKLRVDKRGSGFLKGVGPVDLAGKTRAQAEEKMTNVVSGMFSDMRTRVTFASIPVINVTVLGEAVRPGSYQVNPGSTVLDALLHARGPTRSGSYRTVELQRGGKTIAVFDLYNVLVYGKTAALRLQNGDRVFVPIAGKQVAISGKVSRPAVYELRKEETLAQLLRLSGGVRPDAYSPTIQVNRVTKNQFRKLVDVSLDEAPKFQLVGGDLVTVESVGRDLKNGVFISGSVKRPGWYELEPGMTVSKLVQQAEGMRQGTYPGHAELYRENGPTKPVSMQGFELAKAMAKEPAHDLKLKARDRVVVYAEEIATYNKELVRIQGEVARPGEYPRVDNMRVRDLIANAGGITPEASDKVEVVRTGPEGQLAFIPVDLSAVMDSAGSPDNIELQALDSVMIRKELRKRRWPASVALTGEFRNPGVYAVDPERDTLQDVIERAGGLTREAYPKAAVFTRKLPEILRREESMLAREVYIGLHDVARQIAAVENARRTEKPPALAAGGLDFSTLSKDKTAALPPRVLDHILTSGRVPVNLARIITRGAGDPKVRDGDVLFVPQKPEVVIVSGAVVMPSAVVYHPKKSATAYIKRTGGYSDDAAREKVMVMRVNGELLKANEVDLIEPGDLILVPPKALIAKPDAFERFISILQVVANGAFLFNLTN